MHGEGKSVAEMTSPETEVSTEPIPIPKGKEPIDLLTGVFLKSVYFLDSELTKCAITGVFKNRENSLGVLIKGKKGCVFWSYDSFCQLCDRFNEITLALMGKYQCFITTDTGANIKVCSVFGQHYAYVSDGDHSVTLNGYEWHQLVKNIPLICRTLLEIFYLEDVIKVFIEQVLSDSENRTDQLPSHVADRLYGELSLCKVL